MEDCIQEAMLRYMQVPTFIAVGPIVTVKTRTVFSEENVCPPTSLNRHIVKIDCIYNKLKVTIYLYVSLVKIHPFLNEIGC